VTPAPICPRCGQPVIPPNLPNLSPIKARIFDAVRRHPGIDAESLRAIAWSDDPCGGPEDRKVIHVHVHQLNRSLAPLGIAVRGSISNGYRVQRRLSP
jgi:hypothetical protein